MPHQSVISPRRLQAHETADAPFPVAIDEGTDQRGSDDSCTDKRLRFAEYLRRR